MILNIPRPATNYHKTSGDRLDGVGARFNIQIKPERPGEPFEVFLPGCFSQSLDNDDVIMTVNHDKTRIVAHRENMFLRETASGLEFVAMIEKTDSEYRRWLLQILAGDCRGASVSGFNVKTTQSRSVLKIRQFKLEEIALAIDAIPRDTGTIVTLTPRLEIEQAAEMKKRRGF